MSRDVLRSDTAMKKRVGKSKPKTRAEKEPDQNKSERLSKLTRQPNPPRRSVKSGRRGRR